MNGALTYKDLEVMKRKAKALDDIREWLRGRIDSEKLIAISDMIERAYTEDSRS
jgi:hypothetical protein